ncbi:biotin-independent malonate decarboxylase subunit beta [Bacillus sp. FJAT-45350]|uniref:biotin-independent malonate decarboxylase subunit beta n=1 Tax=Bacillus sp. FJAT-45350 TaxID=2011014 RepID=UPI000BB80165|nr:biotin-independent malonate decarboxylase subunit beta [Bacillus sp. FJAT-45350]
MSENILAVTSFIELSARERVKEILDSGTFREILDPFQRLESPHLESLGIIPQSDDGVVIGRGKIDREPAVVIAIEGAFQGGGIGEVSGAKIAGALELALRDNENGIRTRAVLVLETGGVRLQEGNYGLLAIAEIGAAIVALRRYVPVVCVIPGMIGCFGGMSICASLCSDIIMTRQGRLSLNGPEVIEMEAGVVELDSRDRERIWKSVGGEQRCSTDFADILVEDDLFSIKQSIYEVFERGLTDNHRCSQVNQYLAMLGSIDSSKLTLDGPTLRRDWNQYFNKENISLESIRSAYVDIPIEREESRGRTWIEALMQTREVTDVTVPSVLCSDSVLDDERVRYISVVPNSSSRFYRARNGEVGLEEGWMVAKYVREAVEEDADSETKRAIIAIVDVPSQAYGFHEELLGVNLSCAAALDAYATARLEGHPVITLIVGNAISGAFLAHGLQSNRIIALDDPGVMVQVMSKKSAARVTRRTIAELEEAAKKVPATAYDIGSFTTLGAVNRVLEGIDADSPNENDVANVSNELVNEIKTARASSTRDLRHRLHSEEAQANRKASIKVREKVKEQWN